MILFSIIPLQGVVQSRKLVFVKMRFFLRFESKRIKEENRKTKRERKK